MYPHPAQQKNRGSIIEVHNQHICKCHNETPVQLIYANKNVKYESIAKTEY
jgi:hypothetical protein